MEAMQTDTTVMSVKDWAITLFITSLPLIGLIMLFVWAFSSGNNINKTNFAKGALLLYLIFIGLAIVFFMIFGAMIAGLAGSM
ncbi:MAG: hypothetical protein JJU28_03950 [Cyclobacteriaceae bacterium]|nr:hypothetical protein [Cyclobacteriaceae bacterium]